MQNNVDLNALRQQIRRQRRQLDVFQQQQSELAIMQLVYRLPELQAAKRVGVYLDAFSEIRTRRLIDYLFRLGKQVYLPMICHMNQHLVWTRISRQQWQNRRFYWHRLGMQQAYRSRGTAMQHLDVVFMPLLLCDQQGNRVGMGGGFYDRSLSRCPQKPLRMGLAHDFQYLNTVLPRNPWDQALDGLITPQQYSRFQRALAQCGC